MYYDGCYKPYLDHSLVVNIDKTQNQLVLCNLNIVKGYFQDSTITPSHSTYL
jgi:hypothetical protein